jgi:hypothetical protein
MESYWEVVEPLFSKIEFYMGPEEFADSISSIPRYGLLLFAAHMCLSEVHNGGFLQLLWNSTGILVPEGVEGFTAIGMPRMAALLEQASSTLGTPYPRNRDDRWDALLVASCHCSMELKKIFKKQENLYLAFGEATRTLAFDPIEKQFWEIAKTENGGFQNAATDYARDFTPVG